MRKVFKYIPVFSLWLACLALVSHLMIPHDHHLAEAYTPQEESCPLSNENAANQHGFPVHCHAFNVSDTQRAVIYIFIKENQSDDSSADRPLNAFVFGTESLNTTILDTGIYFYDRSPSWPSALRAPPSLC